MYRKNCGARERTVNFLSRNRAVRRKTSFYERRDVYDCADRRRKQQKRKENIMIHDEPEILRMSEVQLREVDWLWYPYIPFGKLTILQP